MISFSVSETQAKYRADIQKYELLSKIQLSAFDAEIKKQTAIKEALIKSGIKSCFLLTTF